MCTSSLHALAAVIETLPDPRSKQGVSHSYHGMIAIVLLGLIAQMPYVAEMRRWGVVLMMAALIEICRGPKDNFLLALAKDGNADYLITGDKDLLSVKKLGKTQIVKLSEFEKAQAE